jgi:hypothetical protein
MKNWSELRVLPPRETDPVANARRAVPAQVARSDRRGADGVFIWRPCTEQKVRALGIRHRHDGIIAEAAAKIALETRRGTHALARAPHCRRRDARPARWLKSTGMAALPFSMPCA